MDNKSEFHNELKQERETDRLITNEEYEKNISVADNEKYIFIRNIMRVIKETGMRYSSFDYLTVEGVTAEEIQYTVKRKN